MNEKRSLSRADLISSLKKAFFCTKFLNWLAVSFEDADENCWGHRDCLFNRTGKTVHINLIAQNQKKMPIVRA